MWSRRISPLVLSLLLAAAGTCSCGKVEAGPDQPAPSSIPPADGSTPDVDAVDVQSPPHSCPSGLPGPPMVEVVPTHAGTSYCIDSREVSQGEYFTFLGVFLEAPTVSAQKKADAGEWPAAQGCEWNLSLMPGYGDEPCYSQAPSAFSQKNKYPSFAVACVNWCSAYSYCLWAGKRLCGRIGGGALSVPEVTDPAKAEWFNVCSQGGKTTFGYGDVYNPDVPTPNHLTVNGSGLWADSPDQCRGTLSPFDKIQGIGCNVAEWQDACEVKPAATLCSVHIVAPTGMPDEPRCEYHDEAMQQRPDPRIGFRCCHD
ncbi:MAG: hypothetical protein HY898_20940 [Deltaproteobacteria bacterium]|nr:hypothetical protein [Deltaproteobacteria bacterium]